jgi:hypothetical protein
VPASVLKTLISRMRRFAAKLPAARGRVMQAGVMPGRPEHADR